MAPSTVVVIPDEARGTNEMKLEKRLNTWVAESVIDEAAKAHILAFERANSKPKLMFAITGLAALAIGLGFLTDRCQLGKLWLTSKMGIDLVIGVKAHLRAVSRRPSQDLMASGGSDHCHRSLDARIHRTHWTNLSVRW